MDTMPQASWFRSLLVLLALVLAAPILGLAPASVPALPVSVPRGVGDEIEGRDLTANRPNGPDVIEAAFQSESYSPRSDAALKLWTSASGVTVRFFRIGPEHPRTLANDVMNGFPVSAARHLGDVAAGSTVELRVASWPTGLYFAKLTNRNGQIGFAPFIVRPHRLGEHRVAVVLPTLTWQAYNFRDDDHDGKPNTWYFDPRFQARLYRPYLNRGIPNHFRVYDLGFLHWLDRSGRHVDVLSDTDLEHVSSSTTLAAAYDLIVFPGHHEYVTTREYDLVQGYRNLGGNLMFLSADNFAWQVVKSGNTMTRAHQWRDLGRPEAALVGVQYIAWNTGQRRGAWIVRGTAASGWIFARTGSRPGQPFANAGIEIDHTSPASPKSVSVIAEIPDLLGPGKTAQMTYYETARGAKVFAAGAFTLGGAAMWPPVRALLENLWARMTRP